MINTPVLDILCRKSFLCNRISVRLCVTAVPASLSHFGNGIECSLHPKYTMRRLGTEADDVVSQLNEGRQKAAAWGKWYPCAVEEVGFQVFKVDAVPEN